MKRKEIQIYDIVLSKRYMELVSNKFTYDFAWYFSAADKRRSGRVKLHLASERGTQFFDDAEQTLLQVLVDKGYNTQNIYRSFCNCFRRGDRTTYHRDPGTTSYIFYVNPVWKKHWGSATRFKRTFGYKDITPKPGRLIVYPASTLHRGLAPTIFMPANIAGRFSIAFHESR